MFFVSRLASGSSTRHSRRLSCFLRRCGVSWSEEHVSLDCSECGGYSLQRPCPLCDGRCHTAWKRDLTMVNDLDYFITVTFKVFVKMCIVKVFFKSYEFFNCFIIFRISKFTKNTTLLLIYIFERQNRLLLNILF